MDRVGRKYSIAVENINKNDDTNINNSFVKIDEKEKIKKPSRQAATMMSAVWPEYGINIRIE